MRQRGKKINSPTTALVKSQPTNLLSLAYALEICHTMEEYDVLGCIRMCSDASGFVRVSTGQTRLCLR